MNSKLKLLQALMFRMFFAKALAIGSCFDLAAAALDSADPALAKTSKAVPWSQIGAKAGAHYERDGLAVIPTSGGAGLSCVFQRLEGEATREGLWLTSTVTNAANQRFRIVAAAVGREVVSVERGASERQSVEQSLHAPRSHSPRLPDTGTVTIDGQTVRFSRPGLVEEYTVSVDGVRQDFVVLERPVGTGELAVRLAVSGAKVEPTACGARLVLENSGREIAYGRLRVTDATGKELNARMEVASGILPDAGVWTFSAGLRTFLTA